MPPFFVEQLQTSRPRLILCRRCHPALPPPRPIQAFTTRLAWPNTPKRSDYVPYCSSTKRAGESTKWCMKIFVARLAERIGDLGLSQADVARLAGLNERRFNHYARGRRQPDLATLVRLAKTLKTTPNWLLGFDLTDQSQPRNQLEAKVIAACQSLELPKLGLAVSLLTALAAHDEQMPRAKRGGKTAARGS